MKISHFFLPHSETHNRAHLLSAQAFLVYILLFVVLNFGIKIVSVTDPDVLGTSSGITVQEVIHLINVERQKNGLSALTEDARLNQAATAKAKNMFEENYWAHYSPSGKDPWGFIKGAGYQYSYAGENLARNFTNAQDAVNAWMASPSHRDNILSTRYTNVGIAVEDGNLTGKQTTLIVQEFGTPVQYIAQANIPAAVAKAELTPKPEPVKTPVPTPQVESTPAAAAQIIPTSSPSVAKALPSYPAAVVLPSSSVNTFQLSRNISLVFIIFIAFLLLLDIYVIRRRGIVRISSHNLSHFALLGVAASVLFNSTGGSIL